MSREKIHGYEVMGMKLPQILHFSGGVPGKYPNQRYLGTVFLGLWMGWIETFGGMDFMEVGTSFLLGNFVRNIFFRIFRRRNLLTGKMVVPLGWRAPS